MKIQALNNSPSFKGKVIPTGSVPTFFRTAIENNPIINRFADTYSGNIYVSVLKSTDTIRGCRESVYKIILSTKELPKGLWGRIKGLFDKGLVKSSVTNNYREEDLIFQALRNPSKMRKCLKKLKPKN